MTAKCYSHIYKQCYCNVIIVLQRRLVSRQEIDSNCSFKFLKTYAFSNILIAFQIESYIKFEFCILVHICPNCSGLNIYICIKLQATLS